jgi:hypothetical protein
MKLILLLLVCLGTLLRFAPAAESTPKAPPELTALKKRYDDDIESATRSIRERYLSSLHALLRSSTLRNDLAGAVAIQNEIDAIESQGRAPAGLIGTWRFRTGGWSGTRTFRQDGTVVVPDSNKANPATWQADAKQVTITYAGGGIDTLDLPLKASGTKGRSGRAELTATKE